MANLKLIREELQWHPILIKTNALQHFNKELLLLIDVSKVKSVAAYKKKQLYNHLYFSFKN